jgi:hypothetical protein
MRGITDMRVLMLFLLLATAGFAQRESVPGRSVQRVPGDLVVKGQVTAPNVTSATSGAGAPAGACVAGKAAYYDTAAKQWYDCTDTNVWGRRLNADGDGNFAIVATLPTEGIVTVADAALTLAAAHNGKILRFTSAAAVTLTLPSGLGAGFACLIVQRGTGTVAPTAGAGAVIRQRQSLTKTAGQYATATLVCDEPNNCILSGDLQ